MRYVRPSVNTVLRCAYHTGEDTNLENHDLVSLMGVVVDEKCRHLISVDRHILCINVSDSNRLFAENRTLFYCFLLACMHEKRVRCDTAADKSISNNGTIWYFRLSMIFDFLRVFLFIGCAILHTW